MTCIAFPGAGTIDILKEMTTVRQFVMEEKEFETYAVTQLFRRILERRLDTTRRLAGVSQFSSHAMLP